MANRMALLPLRPLIWSAISTAAAMPDLPQWVIVRADRPGQIPGRRRNRRTNTVLTTRRYREIVERFEALARTSLGRPRSIPDICATLAINQRTLTRAVRAVRGATPSRHLHGLALAEARAALRDPATRSVRQVALRCGFRELGRFAADYRTAFGEYPSQTLRRNSTSELDDADCATASHARR
jgi:transcriptional regulator GlxA family with amidase domain